MRGSAVFVGAFIIWTFITWLALDAWLGPNGFPTESQMIAYWARHFTFWAFLLGSLNGHWFLGRRSANYSSWLWPFVAILLLLGWDWAFHHFRGWDSEPYYRSPFIWFFLGLPVGSYFWPQQDPQSPIP